ncbi:hypothetical protein [Mangrovicoccus ximenensis]|uniref:hypothetical protein n=1 Tax=Mangrovicoccus ximenensis TaxID=1911570 RepID=UPI000D363B52|nr:hypothetical protein [Mangrovicoccus ximenensis]
MEIVRIGLDLARSAFQGHCVGRGGRTALGKTLRRDAVVPFLSRLPPCPAGMEACRGSHCWARVLPELGHELRLIAPQFVAPQVKPDSEAERETARGAVFPPDDRKRRFAGRPAARQCGSRHRRAFSTAPLKSPEQLEIQAVRRIRQRRISGRTRLADQVRGQPGEHRAVLARPVSHLRNARVRIAGGRRREDGVPDMIGELAMETRDGLAGPGKRIAAFGRRIGTLFRNNGACRRTGCTDGIGPFSADLAPRRGRASGTCAETEVGRGQGAALRQGAAAFRTSKPNAIPLAPLVRTGECAA